MSEPTVRIATPEDRFPDGFLWGAATSAYQIEGAPFADGAGPSIWDTFARQPATIDGGDTGETACDHYHRYAEDIALMRRLELGAYRFSTAWSRVLPSGRGKKNPGGIDFYDRLVDRLLEAGIRPLLTLYHWDLPSALQDRGGWANPDIAHWFADYAEIMIRALDDRVEQWITINEPWVICDAGYVQGVHPPGKRDLAVAVAVSHNLLRAHGAAVERYREFGRHRVGLTVNLEPKTPATDRAADGDACRWADAYLNRQFLDPLFLGTYPEEMAEMFGEHWVEPSDADRRLMATPGDFLGINYYSRRVVEYDATDVPARAGNVRQPSTPHTAMGWEVYPHGLTEMLLWVNERYGDMPLYVTENGAAFNDPPPRDGHLNDTPRIAYLRDHFRAAHAAMRQGVDLRGYFVWSLLDNFEWTFGFSKRFGLVHVDFETQTRTIKESGRFFADVIRSGGAELFR